MKINEGKILLLFSGMLVGVFIAAFMVNKSLNTTTYLSYKDYEKMSLECNQIKAELRSTNREINKTESKLSIYENSNDKKHTVTDAMKKDLEDLKITYGVEKIEGPGIEVYINDRHKRQYQNSYDLTFSTTHDEDLLFIVKDLKNAGAEGISINGKRIISTSSITCEGPVIMVNGQYIVPPFIISAIGDPDALNYALTMEADSRYKDLQARNLELKITKKDKVVINGIDKIEVPKYAKLKQ